MALVSMRQLLDHAAENGYGIPAFNVNNLEQVQAIMAAASEVGAPVIMQASAGARKYAGESFLRHLIEAAVEAYPDVPVCMHQDHGQSPAVCQGAIRSGFTSVIPVTFGFVKTDNSAYPVNFRCQALVTVTDASVCDVELTVPKGGYASTFFKFSEIAKNIDFAFGIKDLKELAKGLDTENPVYNVYMMDAKGNLNGGPGKYTANGAGYWLTETFDIVNWGKEGFAMFIEPNNYDYDDNGNATLMEDGGGFNIGRLSNETPASGTVLTPSIVIKPVKDTGKTLTINFTLTFE